MQATTAAIVDERAGPLDDDDKTNIYGGQTRY
jgi:hypothetical protein